jgi:hypothetical protein
MHAPQKAQSCKRSLEHLFDQLEVLITSAQQQHPKVLSVSHLEKLIQDLSVWEGSLSGLMQDISDLQALSTMGRAKG